MSGDMPVAMNQRLERAGIERGAKAAAGGEIVRPHHIRADRADPRQGQPDRHPFAQRRISAEPRAVDRQVDHLAQGAGEPAPFLSEGLKRNRRTRIAAPAIAR